MVGKSNIKVQTKNNKEKMKQQYNKFWKFKIKRDMSTRETLKDPHYLAVYFFISVAFVIYTLR